MAKFNPKKSVSTQFASEAELLEFDRQCRQPGAEKPLMGLETIRPRIPEYDNPTLTCEYLEEKGGELCANSFEFKLEFFKAFPVLEGVNMEGMLIAGWVAMWRPLEIFLYDWWPVRRRNRIFGKLAAMPVLIRAR